MHNYTEIYSKRIFVENLSKIIRNNKADHQIYFLTITLKNIHREIRRDAYRSYFKAVYQKLNQHSLSKSVRRQNKKCKMIMVAEKSKDCQSKNMIKAFHYHGFLMVHNDADVRFNERCVTCISNSEKVRNSLSDQILYQNRDFLQCDTCDIQHVSSSKDIDNVSRYITKNFISNNQRNSDFTLSDISRFEKKSDHTLSNYISLNEMSYEDVLLFCEFTQKTTIH